MRVKKITKGCYITEDKKFMIEKDMGYWYGIDAKTYKSVVDSERTMQEIREKIEAKYYK